MGRLAGAALTVIAGALVGAGSVSAAGSAGWKVQPTATPPVGGFAAVACISGTACTAVGTGTPDGFAEAWNGKAWASESASQPGGATESGLQGVSCTSPSACTAVGYYVDGSGAELTLAERWNGSVWSIQSTPNPGSDGHDFWGVSCPGAEDCMAVGRYQAVAAGPDLTLAEEWNGTDWSVVPTPNPSAAGSWSQLMGLSCSSPSACIAVGDYIDGSGDEHLLAEQWDGQRWALLSPRSPAGSTQNWFSGVSCQSSSACTVVGGYLISATVQAFAESWNGTQWTVQSASAGLAAQLRGVSCPTASACIAAGQYQVVNGLWVSLVESWNGERWSVQSTPNPGGTIILNGVSCVSSSTCEAVGGRGQHGIGSAHTLAEGMK